ncbi:hypothetical protein [Rickettsiella endosymbiont of Xylota segnis]|uniref:hypothetical protein n=1 Tax=Rickettsiella endosymbiont of Xylota segnis TaxID=3066238 RepID=UPI0030D08FFA
MRLKKTKVLRYVVATSLTMGTILSVGFLSFSGLWIIYPYIIPATLAFFLSGVIEGKVFGTSIFKGLARLKLLSPNGEKHLLFSELNKLLSMKDESWVNSQCRFLQDYCNQRKKYKALKNNPSANEEDVKEAKQRLEELKDYLYQQMNKPNDSDIEDSYVSQAMKEASLIELNSAKRSVWFLRFFWLISILVGIVSGFVTAFAVQEAITVGLALSLSVTALSAIVWPVAIFAAIGATFLLYYAITDIVKNDAIVKACSKTLKLFKRSTEESIGAYLLRLLALSIVVMGITSLTVFATAASGGTCWIVMQKGIKLLAPKLPIFVAYCASTILIPINFATDLIYGFSTTVQTIDNCKGIFQAIFDIIKHPIKAIKNFCTNIETKLNNLKEKESWGQFFNPFRILAKLIISPLQSLVFIGHLISIGLTTDRFMNVPPPLVAGVCAVAEGLQDLSFLTTEEGHNHAQHDHEEDDGHDHGNLLQLPLQILLSPVLTTVGFLYWFVKKCGNEVGFLDAIAQTFELPLLNIVFFPLLLPSAIWHWTFKKSENHLTFFESIKENFDIHSHDHDTPEQTDAPKELSAEWRENVRVQWKLNSYYTRLNSKKIDTPTVEKQNCIIELSSEEGLKHVVNELKNGKDIDKVLSQYPAGKAKKSEESKPLINGHNVNGSEAKKQDSFSNILNKHRSSFFNSEETRTLQGVKDAFCLVRTAG